MKFVAMLSTLMLCMISAGCGQGKQNCSELTDADERLACYDGTGKAPQTADAVEVPSVAEVAQKPPTDEQQVQEAVRSLLIDPTDPIFGQFTRFKKYACLTVNSRNRYGGYTGDKQVMLVYESIYGWVSMDIDLGSLDSHATCVEIIKSIATKEAFEVGKQE